MPAMIICGPSWGCAEVVENSGPEQAGAALFALIQRDGQDDASDTIYEHRSWHMLDPDTKEGAEAPEGTVAVEGYGFAYVSANDGSDGDYDYAYGILSDGAIMASCYIDSQRVAILPGDPEAHEKLKTLADGEAF